MTRPSSVPRRAGNGAVVPATLWRDWRWQLAHRLRTPEALSALLPLTPAERRALAAPSAWRMPLLLTPSTASLLATLSPSHPLRRAHLP
ncbi:MAG: lysine 2,3-aminomutase, partial [Kiritimatiellae bacterium]|nr:lysine 2,3-aminomutase [Kiritimatiellia bacterium]